MGTRSKKNDVDGKINDSAQSPAPVSEYVTNKVFKDYMNKLMNKMSDLTTRLDGVLEENRKLREEASAREVEILKLNKRVDVLEQRSRINNVEIANFPITTNEKPAEIVKAAAQLVGMEIKDVEIQAVHRVPRYDNKVKNIVVQFVSRWKKNIFIQSCINYRKNHNNSISASAINSSLSDQPVYISEHLSPKMKVLLAKTRKRVREVGWMNAHTRDGVIYAKKDENDKKKTLISEEADLVKIK